MRPLLLPQRKSLMALPFVFPSLTLPTTSVTAVEISALADSSQICIRTSHGMCRSVRNGTYLTVSVGLPISVVSRRWNLPKSYPTPWSYIPLRLEKKRAVRSFWNSAKSGFSAVFVRLTLKRHKAYIPSVWRGLMLIAIFSTATTERSTSAQWSSVSIVPRTSLQK